jgi:methylated-DNA-[protein]-cysteine S-methyltransferase
MNYDDVVYTEMDSPVGPIMLARVEAGITHILFQKHKYPAKIRDRWRRDDAALRDATNQLRAYFSGESFDFDLALAPAGTPFQKKVWAALREIRCGETESYGQLAARIGFPDASRAVGAANGRNPIAIVVPCHRVIGANGTLTGYAGGLHIKKALLEHEARMVKRPGEQLALAST